MGDQILQNAMNLDLNLGPVEEAGGLNLEDWLDGSVREAVGNRTIVARQRWRSIWQPVLFPTETRTVALEFMGVTAPGGSETGEASMAAGTSPEAKKEGDEGNNIAVEKEDAVKSNGNEGGYFDCNICLNMASDPVVASCGHLFCWPCLYRRLHIHSETKECPICKAEMTTKSVTPIYGRGNPTRVIEQDSSIKIPHRPPATRVESWRQTIQRNPFTMPMEEMIRRLNSRFDLTRDLVPGLETRREVSERNNSLLNRYLISRERSGFHGVREQTSSMEDRDSMSSIAAVIQTESQTVDTAVDSRVSDVDSGDSRAPRRRRLR